MKRIVLLCYGLVAMGGLAFAFAYLFKAEFMPYHAVAVGRAWTEVEPPFQFLVLALMKVCGGGMLAASISIIYLSLVYYKSESFWPSLWITIIGLAALTPSLIATLSIYFNTKAEPPWKVVLGMMVLLLAGFVLSTFCHVKKNQS